MSEIAELRQAYIATAQAAASHLHDKIALRAALTDLLNAVAQADRTDDALVERAEKRAEAVLKEPTA